MGSLVGLGKGGSARYHDGRCDHHQGEKLGAGRNLGCIGRQAELERLKHATKIGIDSGFAKATSTAPPAVVRGHGEAVPGSLLLGGVTRYPNRGGWGWFLRKRRPRVRSAAWGAPTLQGRVFSPDDWRKPGSKWLNAVCRRLFQVRQRTRFGLV